MAKKYVDDIARILCDQLDIVDVVSSRVALKKTGKNYKGLCPFHSEKTPSFIVSQERQSYKCFGCGAGGSALGFVMETENLDFLTALETLAERYHVDLTPYRNQDFESGKARDLKVFYELNRRAAHSFYRNLKEDQQARTYLLDRGLSEKTLVHYGLGFAKDSWHSLYEELAEGLGQEIIEESGLFGQGTRGNYDRFRNRIMFPIIDLRRRVIGFGARTMDPQGIPKYLNTADTPVFNKSYHLYGLNHAKDYRGEKRRIFLVEGYMDVISLYDKGVGNAVASLGTAFTREQAKLLERYCQELIILYDGDSAGIEATKRALEILDDFSMNIKVVTLPDEMDPDDYISNFGKDNFLAYVNKEALDSYEYRIRDIEKNHNLNSIPGKRSFLEEIGQLLGKIKTHAQQDLYIRYVANRLGLSAQELRKDIKIASQEPLSRPRQRRSDEAPSIMMAIMLQNSQIVQEAFEHKWFFLLDQTWQELIAFLKEEGSFNLDRASELFSLDQVEYMAKAKEKALYKSDFEHWESFFSHLIAAQLDRRVSMLQESTDASALEEIMLLQKMRIEVMAKEGGGRW